MNKKFTQVAIHIVIWAYIFFSPFMFSRDDDTNLTKSLAETVVPAVLCCIFYFNYLYITPKYLEKSKQLNKFLVINVVIAIAATTLVHLWMVSGIAHPMPHHIDGINWHHRPATIFFVIKDLFGISMTIGISTAIRLSIAWGHAEKARQKAEIDRTKAENEKNAAELKTLRNQINPHFLLNTLNNIYALIAFDTDKAQKAVLELSKMLRHVLYDNQQPTVNLADEMKFLNSYIDLMRIRLQDNVEVKVDIKIPEPCTIQIAPLVFISLIENAFKHGVSPTLHSFIHVKITANNETITCDISNSNFPKKSNDKSGHGIGLQQIKKRLDISYPNMYEWTCGANEDGSVYNSIITLKLQ
jgi:two-component sensor histidine kinase